MFNSKNPPPPPMPWTLQLLTRDHLISGTFAPQAYLSGDANFFKRAARHATLELPSITVFGCRQINNGTIQSMITQNSQQQSFSTFYTGSGNTIMAVVPVDENSLFNAQSAFEKSKYPIAGNIFVGPYYISGTLLSTKPDIFEMPNDNIFNLLPVKDAVIQCQPVNPTFQALHVAYVLVNNMCVDGILFN
jgi:hypothetical protein